MSRAGARAAALDAAVQTTEREQRKALAAVEYHRREHAAALDAVERLAGKGDRLRTLAEAADAELQTALAEVDTKAEQLADAEAHAEEVA